MLISSLLLSTKAKLTGVIAAVIAALAAAAYAFKLKADIASEKLKTKELELTQAQAATRTAKERVKRHEERQSIESDVYSANESHIDEQLRKYTRD